MISDSRIDTILAVVSHETDIPRSRLALDARIADLEIASLDMVQAIFELEAKFGIEIPVMSGGGGAEFETVGDLVRHVTAAIDHAHQAGHPAS